MRRLLERDRFGEQWLHVNEPFAHQIDGKPKFFIEPKRAPYLKLLRYDEVHRELHLTTKPELDDDAARSEDIQGTSKSGLIARGFKENIERTLVLAVRG
jgi:hypothetical protein